MDKNEIKPVSVVVPVYGVEKYIERCAESLFTQTFADKIQYIFVDDCSPDNSVSILRTISEKYSELDIQIVSHEKNKGLAGARNTGLEHATGEYFITVDSDDWCEPKYIEDLYNAAIENNADVVGCDLIVHDKNGSHIRSCPLFNTGKECLSGLCEGKLQGWLHIKLIRRNQFYGNNIHWIEGINLCEDLLISAKIFASAENVIYLPEALYNYNRLNENSYTQRLNENRANQIIRAVADLEKFLQEKKMYDELVHSVNLLRSSTKIWILQDSEEIKSEYIELYNDCELWREKKLPLVTKIFQFLCRYAPNLIVKMVIRLKNSLRKHSL